MWDPYSEFQKATLANGLTIYAAHWPERPWEAVGFLIHSGAEQDPIRREGLAHFIEHLLQANASIPRKEIARFFDESGGWVNFGQTYFFSTHYQFFLPSDKALLAKAFSIFGQMLLSAQLERSIEHERQLIISEFYHRYPVKIDFDLVLRAHKALYQGYFLERFASPIGSPESVERITQKELQYHYDLHYNPKNLSIVGVGGLKLQEMVELISESPFGINKKGERTPLPIPVNEVKPPSETRCVIEASEYFTQPLKVGIYRTLAKIPGKISSRVVWIIQKMLEEILDEEIRERRAWAYHIDLSRSNFRYFHQFSIECRPLALETIDQVEEIIENSISSLKDQKELFERIKRQTLASVPLVDLTGQKLCHEAMEDLALYQRIISINEAKNEFEQMEMDEIENASKWLQPDWRWTLIIRP